MAVKVSGTTVINDSRNIENITTINGTDWATVVSNAAEGAEINLNELTDVTIGTLASGEIVYYDGAGWINTQLTFADLGATPTTLAGYGITDAMTSTQVNSAVTTAVSNLVDFAPTALDTLNELSAALNDDADFANTMTTALAGKVDDSQVLTDVPAGAVFTDTTYTDLNEFTNTPGYITGYTVTEGDVTGHQAALSITESQISDFGSYEAADATILKDADIGVTVEAFDATILKDADIGVNVQAYDANLVSDATYVKTDENFTTADHTKLNSIETGATADQTAAEIKTAYETNADTNAFTDAEQAKLTGIEANATADQTDAEIKTAYENNANTNAFTDAEQTKLTGIEANATADQTAAEIKAAYESNADTNEFSDAEQTKLAGIEASADVTDAANVEPLVDSHINVSGATSGQYLEWDGADYNWSTVDLTTQVTRSGDTMTGFLTLHSDPTNALHAATKEYVDTIAAAGIHYHTPVRVESPLNLTVTYNNGTNGVGATLTNAGTQEAITIDGVALSSGDRVLVYEQTDATQNGIYTVTTVGSGSTNWVLTRATDADSYGASDPNAMGEGDAYFVKEGATGAGELYVMNTAGTITFGTTDITFTVIAETAVYTAGTGLTLDGTVFSIGQAVGTSSNVTFNNIAVTGTVDGRDLALDGSKLDGIESGATADQTAAEIRTLVESATDSNVFTDADHTKLNAIEANATADQTASEIRALVESATDSNVFTDADHTKLNAIEANATADQTAAEIRALVESATDSNVFTDADHTKLNGIESGATADQTKSDIDALNINADTLDGQHGSYYTGYTDTAVSNLVASAPGTLDTLNELAAALGDDPNFATTTATNISAKANKTITVSAGSGLTGGGDLTANRTLAIADGGVGTTQLANDAVTAAKIVAGAVGSSEIANNAVALGTQTTGNYVSNVSGGTGVTVTGTAGEGWTSTIAIGQNVATTANVTFATVTATSDARLKDNIETMTNAMDILSGIRGVTYDWKSNGEAHAGVIAQEVKEVMPCAVKDNGEQLSVDYHQLVGVLIQAVKELKEEVETLKNK